MKTIETKKERIQFEYVLELVAQVTKSILEHHWTIDREVYKLSSPLEEQAEISIMRSVSQLEFPRVKKALAGEGNNIGDLVVTAKGVQNLKERESKPSSVKEDILHERFLGAVKEGKVEEGTLESKMKQMEAKIDRIEECVRRLEDHLTRKKSENEINEDDYLRPPTLYAVRFQDEDRAKGAYVLHARADGIALPGDIYLIEEKDLDLLNRAELRYDKYESTSRDPKDVLRHFGIDPGAIEAPGPSLIEIFLQYLRLKLRKAI